MLLTRRSLGADQCANVKRNYNKHLSALYLCTKAIADRSTNLLPMVTGHGETVQRGSVTLNLTWSEAAINKVLRFAECCVERGVIGRMISSLAGLYSWLRTVAFLRGACLHTSASELCCARSQTQQRHSATTPRLGPLLASSRCRRA